jgi:hypothetical protein
LIIPKKTIQKSKIKAFPPPNKLPGTFAAAINPTKYPINKPIIALNTPPRKENKKTLKLVWKF